MREKKEEENCSKREGRHGHGGSMDNITEEIGLHESESSSNAYCTEYSTQGGTKYTTESSNHNTRYDAGNTAQRNHGQHSSHSNDSNQGNRDQSQTSTEQSGETGDFFDPHGYYQLLGITPKATKKEIKDGYKKKSITALH